MRKPSSWCLVSWFSVVKTAADAGATDRYLPRSRLRQDRDKARVVAPFVLKEEPASAAWATELRRRRRRLRSPYPQGRANTSKEEERVMSTTAVDRYVGVDVSKARLDVAVRPTGERYTIVRPRGHRCAARATPADCSSS